MADTDRLLLASSSPRRRELIAGLGLDVAFASPDIDETRRDGEQAVAYVTRLALAKVAAGAADDDVLVIAADTTVDLDGAVLEKPVDLEDARRMLVALSGRAHRVHTGLALRLGDRVEHEVITTAVAFIELTDAMIEWYVATGEPLGKAGAYALQGRGGMFVAGIDGSVSNVIGLPMSQVLAMAARLGRPLVG